LSLHGQKLKGQRCKRAMVLKSVNAEAYMV